MSNTISVIIKFTFEICGNGVTDGLFGSTRRITPFVLLSSGVHLAFLLSIRDQRIRGILPL
jgi:hypothetical protein